MSRVIGYHRPTTVEAAVALLGEPGAEKVLIGGGTAFNGRRGLDEVVVVDLQASGLDTLERKGSRLRMGSTVSLGQLASQPGVPEGLADLARREVPSTLRGLATVGGVVAGADSESELLAGLLAHRAVVSVAGSSGSEDLPLATVLESGPAGRVITAVTVETGGVVSAQRTGRTPADRPIVAAVARRAPDGEVTVAMSGVADVPVVVSDVASLVPPADFRGSSAYRIHLARVLHERALSEVV